MALDLQNLPADWSGWKIEAHGRILVRINRELVYDGPVEEMPPEVKALADQMPYDLLSLFKRPSEGKTS